MTHEEDRMAYWYKNQINPIRKALGVSEMDFILGPVLALKAERDALLATVAKLQEIVPEGSLYCENCCAMTMPKGENCAECGFRDYIGHDIVEHIRDTIYAKETANANDSD